MTTEKEKEEADALIDQAIDELPMEGPLKALVGKVMQVSKGKANPIMAKRMMFRKLYGIPYYIERNPAPDSNL